MENNIIKDFQNLQVLAAYDWSKMDELVHDLTAALEESSKSTRQTKSDDGASIGHHVRRCSKKRRGKKRRPPGFPYLEFASVNMSEASESSFDEALKDYMENVTQQSDSDDWDLSRRMGINMPLSTVSLAESDSVTENMSPVRPHRRRRKFKQIEIDNEPGSDIAMQEYKPRKKRLKARNSAGKEQNMLQVTKTNIPVDKPMLSPTSLKRRFKDGVNHDSLSTDSGKEADGESMCEDGQNKQRPQQSQDTGSPAGSSSSSLSSSEQDDLGDDDGREGDDEQSDFFHEPGPACGIPGIVPWWEKERVTEDMADPKFQQILTGSFKHMSLSSQRSFRNRLKKMQGMHGREIRMGRRRVKERRPGYTAYRYVQHPNEKDDVQKLWPSGSPVNQSIDIKRRRKTSPIQEGHTVGGNAEPIPASNIGNKMLQNMGWTPGTGLGADRMGIQDPVMAYMRPRRQGLGVNYTGNT